MLSPHLTPSFFNGSYIRNASQDELRRYLMTARTERRDAEDIAFDIQRAKGIEMRYKREFEGEVMERMRMKDSGMLGTGTGTVGSERLSNCSPVVVQQPHGFISMSLNDHLFGASATQAPGEGWFFKAPDPNARKVTLWDIRWTVFWFGVVPFILANIGKVFQHSIFGHLISEHALGLFIIHMGCFLFESWFVEHWIIMLVVYAVIPSLLCSCY